MKKSLKKTLKVGESKIHGKGLFATETIKKGSVIGYCKTRKTKKEGSYTLWLGKGPVDVTCRLKYINHNRKPNVAYFDDLSVVALRKIKAGQELTHHYGEDWD